MWPYHINRRVCVRRGTMSVMLCACCATPCTEVRTRNRPLADPRSKGAPSCSRHCNQSSFRFVTFFSLKSRRGSNSYESHTMIGSLLALLPTIHIPLRINESSTILESFRARTRKLKPGDQKWAKIQLSDRRNKRRQISPAEPLLRQ